MEREMTVTVDWGPKQRFVAKGYWNEEEKEFEIEHLYGDLMSYTPKLIADVCQAAFMLALTQAADDRFNGGSWEDDLD